MPTVKLMGDRTRGASANIYKKVSHRLKEMVWYKYGCFKVVIDVSTQCKFNVSIYSVKQLLI